MLKHMMTLSMCAAALLFSGCGPGAGSPEEREEKDPLIQSGQAFMQQEQWDDAITAFKQALDNEPRMARPHLDLAVIYQQHKPNFIHAIYHYDRYLELRPDSEKAEFIREQKVKLVKGLANTFISNSPEVKEVVQEAQRLRNENTALRRQIEEAREKLAAARKGTGTTASTKTTATTGTTAGTQASTARPRSESASSASTTSTSNNVKIYHVVGGDTLTKIAQKFYGNDDWEPIYEANRDAMRSPGDLKVGQTLVIPMTGTR